jgi:PAS domain-containing protein
LATNRKEVVFCSENVETILGYTVDQVMGLGYWKLTEDTEFYGEEYHTKFLADGMFIRKIKCKMAPINSYNGTIKDFLKT